MWVPMKPTMLVTRIVRPVMRTARVGARRRREKEKEAETKERKMRKTVGNQRQEREKN